MIEIAHAPRPRRDAADDEIIRRLRSEPQPGAGARRDLGPAGWPTRPAPRAPPCRAPRRSGRSSTVCDSRAFAPCHNSVMAGSTPVDPPRLADGQGPPPPGTPGWRVTPAPDGRGGERPPGPADRRRARDGGSRWSWSGCWASTCGSPRRLCSPTRRCGSPTAPPSSTRSRPATSRRSRPPATPIQGTFKTAVRYPANDPASSRRPTSPPRSRRSPTARSSSTC